MPDGIVEWFDDRAGEADVAAGGRHLRALARDVEPVARHPGVRVYFDVVREGGVDRAVRVRLRRGTRVSHLQGRFGTLVGAPKPDLKGRTSYERVHPGLAPAAARHPLEVARAWASCVARGDADGAVALYAPDAAYHAADGRVAGPGALRAELASWPVFGSGRHAAVRGADGTAVVVWPGTGPDEPGWSVQSRIEHASIVEQWPLESSRAEEVATVEGGLAVAVAASGDVGEAENAYAVSKVRAVAGHVDEPVLFARVRLAHEPQGSVARPAVAKALVDVNGDLVRAHVASHTLREAVDLLEQRLHDKLVHRAARRLARRHETGLAEPGEWRNVDLHAARPDHFPRPVEERQLVRLKSLAIGALSPDEAIFDMGQLDFDFYLFREFGSGADSLVERRPDGSFLLHSLAPRAVRLGPTASPVEISRQLPPVLTVDEAIERLNAGGERFVFFANASTGRGNVVYLRYDGHYGLLDPQ